MRNLLLRYVRGPLLVNEWRSGRWLCACLQACVYVSCNLTRYWPQGNCRRQHRELPAVEMCSVLATTDVGMTVAILIVHFAHKALPILVSFRCDLGLWMFTMWRSEFEPRDRHSRFHTQFSVLFSSSMMAEPLEKYRRLVCIGISSGLLQTRQHGCCRRNTGRT